MFNFDFEIEDDGVNRLEPEATPPQIPNTEPFAELSLSQLLDSLPPLITYSPLSIPLSSSRKNVTLARRDLFDARFQLISEGEGDEPAAEKQRETPTPVSALGFLDAPSDLVPGIYEGGLKTWECSLDLVGYLDGLRDPNSSYFSGKRILEVGCGTGIPSVYLLSCLFSENSTVNAHLVLQDYNASVLELITFPNIILAWYMSPASTEYRATDAECPPADPTIPGELTITPSLKSAFTASVTRLGISLAFFSGSWESLATHLGSVGAKHDIALTSETIYRTEALPALIQLLRQAYTATPSLCLVAAKVLYFGVGGGVSEFLRTLQSKTMVERGLSGTAETVWGAESRSRPENHADRLGLKR
ncbi:hypothetical protein MSAN_00082000 [Mycena sanguinolenta]|uniref:protein-histidine N-methyltransferase n=1 Tax=Mycena sanguinolenta TaxID=230812 RepID=A0A8H6ZFB1_9AGAR|nr:hypothetical protein MSAN_00082000 [Mycena sanguinolenta]